MHTSPWHDDVLRRWAMKPDGGAPGKGVERAVLFAEAGAIRSPEPEPTP